MSANPTNVYSFPFRGALPQWDERSSGHTVHLYESDEALLQELTHFLASVLGAGDSGVVVCTQAHRRALDQLLPAQGVDLAAVGREGRYIVLDARQTLSAFLQDDPGERRLSSGSVGMAVSQAAAAATGRLGRVAAFDEMAALLYTEGKVERALHVEQSWTDLLQTQDIDLHCAYPLAAFQGVEHTRLLERICSRHRRVLPAESYAGLHIEDTRLRHVALLQQKAHSLELERKRAREMVAERNAQVLAAEDRLRFIQKAARVASWELDLLTQKYFWSDEVFELFGLEKTSARPSQSDFLSLMYFSTDRDNVQRALNATRSRNREYRVDFRIRRPDGEVRWISTQGRIYRTAAGESLFGIFRDITESR